MITSAQIRAGRGLLKWTQGALAARAGLSVVTLNMIETDQVRPRVKTLEAIRRALERDGVAFVGDEEGGFGVVLRRPR
jgi:transcriptional regulator with XRE-family HTH domain